MLPGGRHSSFGRAVSKTAFKKRGLQNDNASAGFGKTRVRP
jgi:hypothetical protein